MTPSPLPPLLEDTEEASGSCHSREGLCQHWAIRQDAPPFRPFIWLESVEATTGRWWLLSRATNLVWGRVKCDQLRFFGLKGSSGWVRSSFFLSTMSQTGRSLSTLGIGYVLLRSNWRRILPLWTCEIWDLFTLWRAMLEEEQCALVWRLLRDRCQIQMKSFAHFDCCICNLINKLRHFLYSLRLLWSILSSISRI